MNINRGCTHGRRGIVCGNDEIFGYLHLAGDDEPMEQLSLL